MNLQAGSLARPVIVNKHVVRAIHGHTILGSHFNSAIRPARCELYDDAKIPLVPARVGDVAKTELIAGDRKSTRLNSSHITISYAVFCLKKKKKKDRSIYLRKKHSIQPSEPHCII